MNFVNLFNVESSYALGLNRTSCEDMRWIFYVNPKKNTSEIGKFGMIPKRLKRSQYFKVRSKV